MEELPRNNPLNAKITGTIEKENYTVEKIIYESQPQLYVTACMFIPKKRKKKTPAIIYCSGHTDLAFRSATYQNVILNLVDKGFIVLAIDPIGQGERSQYFNSERGKSAIGGPTKEHSYVGAQCLLSGTCLTNYMIMDGVKAVDYLLTRPEVDAEKIGITGRSGGGTQSAFIAAYDHRIYAAAPECYLTSFKRIFEFIGPQDAEQNPMRFIDKGFDHADLINVRAPSPLLMVTTTNDFFSIQGARETFAEVSRTYDILGEKDNIDMVEDLAGHKSTLKNREAVCRFFQKHFDMPGDYREVEVEIFEKEDLHVTKTGQLSTSLGGNTVFDLNKAYTEKKLIANNPDAAKIDQTRESLIEKINAISGYKGDREVLSTVYTGKEQLDGYSVEKYFIQTKNSTYPIPFLLSKPNEIKKSPLIIYLDDKGKNELMSDNSTVKQLTDKGYAVLLPDLYGTGEIANNKFRGDSHIRGISYNIWFGANLVGRSITGIRADDLNVLMKSVLIRSDIDASNITVIAKGGMASALLHYAPSDTLIKNIVLIKPLISHSEIATTEHYQQWILPSLVPASLGVYDLNILEALIAPRIQTIINPVSADGTTADNKKAETHYSVVKEMYDYKKANNKFKVLTNNKSDIENVFSAIP
jgi:dienelactone hydrolase